MTCAGTNAFSPWPGPIPCPCPSPCQSPCPPACVFCGPTGASGPPAIGASYAFTVGYGAAAPASIGAAPTAVVFNQVPDGLAPAPYFSPVTGSFRVPEDGLYLVSPCVSVDFASGTATAKVVFVSISVNNVAISSFDLTATALVAGVATRYGTAAWSSLLSLKANDVVQIKASTDLGTLLLVPGTFPSYATSLAIVSLF